MSAPTPSHCWLQLRDGRTIWLSATCSIGRQADNDLVLDSPALSRRHALLVPDGDTYAVNDLHSRNGTYLNGTAVTRPLRLRHGDEIKVGDALIRFHCTRGLRETTTDPSNIAVTQRLDQSEERVCWLLLIDVAGSASLNQQVGSAAAHRQIQTWISGLQPLIEQHHGRINGYLGDAIFGYWPADTVPSSDVLATLDAIEQWRPSSPLLFRVVLHHGRALFTHSERGEELSGHDVNFLFRSEKVAKSIGAPVVLTEPAMFALKLKTPPRALGRATLDGVTGAFNFYGWR